VADPMIEAIHGRFNPLQGICPFAANLARRSYGDYSCFNPLQGICPSAACVDSPLYPPTSMFQSLTGNLPFCGWKCASPPDGHHSVSIPYRESALLRRERIEIAGSIRRRFNPLQGICPSAALVSARHIAPPFCFNPLQGICPSAARLQSFVPFPPAMFQSLTGNLPFCGGKWSRVGPGPKRFQSLTGNLPFCGRLSPQHCIFRLLAPNARASPPKVSKSHRSIGGMSVSYPIKLWHVNRFFISERPQSIS
jgi:hypothetical protein